MLSRKILLAGQGAGGGGGGGGGGTGQYYGYTSTATATNGPAGPGLVNTWYRRELIAFVYTSSELSTLGLSANDVITKLRWNVTQIPLSNRMPFPNYAIRMSHISSATNTSNPSGASTGANRTTVKNQHNYNAYTPGTGLHEMTLDNSFTWNGSDGIGFVFAWGQCPTGYDQKGQQTVLTTGNTYYKWSDQPGTYTVDESTTSTISNKRPAIDLFAT